MDIHNGEFRQQGIRRSYSRICPSIPQNPPQGARRDRSNIEKALVVGVTKCAQSFGLIKMPVLSASMSQDCCSDLFLSRIVIDTLHATGWGQMHDFVIRKKPAYPSLATNEPAIRSEASNTGTGFCDFVNKPERLYRRGLVSISARENLSRERVRTLLAFHKVSQLHWDAARSTSSVRGGSMEP